MTIAWSGCDDLHLIHPLDHAVGSRGRQLQIANEKQFEQSTHLEIKCNDFRALGNAADTAVNAVFLILAVVGVVITRPPDDIGKSCRVIYELDYVSLLVGYQFVQSF